MSWSPEKRERLLKGYQSLNPGPKRIRVEVTKEDIATGTPIQTAVMRAAQTDSQLLTKVIGKGLKTLLPEFVSLKIQLFDSTGEMEPFGFEIEV